MSLSSPLLPSRSVSSPNAWTFVRALIFAWNRDRPWRRHDVRQVFTRQLYFTGLQAFRLVALSALIFAFVSVAQSGAHLQRFAGASSIGPILVAAFVRELGPLLTLLIVVARSVSAVASELAAMKAQREIDSLVAAGLSPLSYLVVPRVLGGAVATLLLAMHFVCIAFVAGYFATQFQSSMPWGHYWQYVVQALNVSDLLVFFLKTFVLSFFLFSIACFAGLSTKGASFEIPQATTRAVVLSFLLCFGVQISISVVYYLWMFRGSGFGGLL